MARIEIYTKQRCPYCNRAVRLLESKGLVFEQYDITEDDPKRIEMISRAKGRLTVPQIFVDGRHIGGSDDLVALEQAGRLDPMLMLTTPVEEE